MSNLSILQNYLFDYANTSNTQDRSNIEKEVWEKFGVQGAVLILDMAHFSLTTQSKGIIYYLMMIRRMQVIVCPIINQYNGKVVKFEADNGFFWFTSVGDAIDAAIAMNIAMDAMNRTTPEELDIQIACGIDYGDFLLIEEKDFFGDPVNKASKLGEDLAESGEILITQKASAQMGETKNYQFESMQYSISGINLEAYRVLY